MNPKIEKERIAAEAHQKLTQQSQPAATPAVPGQAQTAQGAVPGAVETRDQAIAKSARVSIDTAALSGSINLTGARFDDLKLKEYHETVDDKSPLITLFSPSDTPDGYFTELGYIGNEASGTVPGPATVWTLASGDKLTTTTPVVLTFTNEKGLVFTRTISIDDHFMFQVVDSINNGSGAPVSMSTYGRVTRFNKPTTPSVYVLHEGFIGVIGEHGLNEVAYSKVENDVPAKHEKATTGWLGITDKYWAATIVPPQNLAYESKYEHFTDGRPRFQADYKQDAVTIAPGQSTELKTLVFAGAKQVPLVDGYEKSYSIPQFDLLIDWGWFYFITKPMFKLMDFFFRYFGNFGVAILLTTIVVKLLFFPLASKQYASMANMKKVQPKMEELKKKHGERPHGLAAGHDGSLQGRKDQPDRRLLADPAADSGVLRALQGDLRHHRNAPRPILRLDSGLVRTGPDLAVQPVRPLALRRPACAGYRRLAADHGHHHVPADAHEPDTAGSDAGHAVHLDAAGLHLHAGQLPGRSGHLLGLEQHAVDHPAGVHHETPWRQGRAVRQSQGICSRRNRNRPNRPDSPKSWTPDQR